MKIYLVLTAILIILMMLLPSVLTAGSDASTQPELSQQNEVKSSENISVLRVSSGKVENITVKEYVIGAVACEMPASFNEEALKAQAVASYTYMMWILGNSDNPGNEISNITDSSDNHQGYLNKDEMKEKWGDKFDFYYNKIEQAVSLVEGRYLSYNGSPALTVFHGLSAGTTNSSEDVWGNALPYLACVSAPGDKLSSDIDSTVSYTAEEFTEICKKEGISVCEIGESVCSDSGYVNSVTIGEKVLDGTEMSRMFNLRSPNFTIEEKENEIIFHVKGKGHGIGMSQYSADFMARQGSSYKEILAHFYPGTTVENTSA